MTKCQVSSVKCQVSGAKFQVSGAKRQVSGGGVNPKAWRESVQGAERIGDTLRLVLHALDSFDQFVEAQIQKARHDAEYGKALRRRWRQIRQSIPVVETPTGLKFPRLALPQTDEPAEIGRFLAEEGLPGEFPFVNGAYREMYLEEKSKARVSPAPEIARHVAPSESGDISPQSKDIEEPTRLFAGLGLAEDTNKRFHYLNRHQRNIRLSTAFDSPTLYGLDSDADGAFGKIGEGGVAIDTVEDMDRLYGGFPLGDEHFSVSMTINGPAPIILAMYVAAAKRRFGEGVVSKLRGTVQADILKEVQAQNEMIFPTEAALRFLTDMVEFATDRMPRWYPISISGYHIAEAGATPVQQAAYTLSNGFAYVDMFRARGLDVNRFGPRLSFFLDCALDIEYLALGRVCRKIWALAMRDVFGANERAQLFKLHTQTSGRSLVAHEFKNNLTRTAIELILAYANATNSCHSNSADEPFTTPSEEYVRLAAHAQAIVLEESGLFKAMMNTLSGSPGMKIVERAVESAVRAELQAIAEMGGVLGAIEHRYQRSQIQASAHRYERQIEQGVRPVIGVNRYASEPGIPARANGEDMAVVRTARARKQQQIARLRRFKQRHRKAAGSALDRLAGVVENGGNVFAELILTVESCSLGQITERLQQLVGRYRPSI